MPSETSSLRAPSEGSSELLVKAHALSSARWAMGVDRLVSALVRTATLAPGGTRWPSFRLPSEHASYAVLRFDGEIIYAGGEDPARANEALAELLLLKAFEIPEGGGDRG